jgi:hypothetical protein
MVPCGFDLKVDGRHVVEKARVHEVVGINTRLSAVPGRTVEKACDGPHGLQEGGHAEVIE